MAEIQPSQNSGESDIDGETSNVTPGLLGLNLNILQCLDMNIINEAKANISKLIDKEHFIVQNVQRNLMALLMMKIPRERRAARIEIENLKYENPNNLNVLADLEFIYREQHRSCDADECYRSIERIMNGKSKTDLLHKQTCLLEQGYAILIERTLMHGSTIELRITDLKKILTTEFERSAGIRKEWLERGLHYQMQVLRNIQNANEEESQDGHIIRKGSSLQKFEKAETMASGLLPHNAWDFYYAKALNQYYDSLETRSKYGNVSTDEMATVTTKAVEKFWKISQLRIYKQIHVRTIVARSYAYMGHILIKRGDLVRTNQQRFDFIATPKFQKYLNSPLKLLDLAFRLKSDDVTVLNRYGRVLWNLAGSTLHIGQKMQYLTKANEVLSFSISYDNNRNWFAQSTRMVVRLNIADLELGASSVEYLQLAKQDGHACFLSRTTRKDMTILAGICQKLAKHPCCSKYGPRYVKQKDYLHQALDYLSFATNLGDSPPDFHWTNRTASCLFDLGEYENAIEWQRKAWFRSSPTTSISFYLLCTFLITMFEEQERLPKPTDLFLREFLSILIYARSKYMGMTDKNRSEPEELFVGNMKGLLKNKQDGLLQLLKEIIIKRTLMLVESEKKILCECFEIWRNMSLSSTDESTIVNLEEQLKVLPTEKETEYTLSDVFRKTSLLPVAKGLGPFCTDYTYDFFVSHSHKDQYWVVEILLRHLESKFDEEDVVFRGCIADRDFIPGKSVFGNIIDAIKGSHKVILILTEHFIDSNWCQYEADHAIINSLDLDSGKEDLPDCDVKRKNERRNCVIPVILEDCEIPDKIKHLNFIDLTSKQDFMQQMTRLKKALFPC